MKLISVDDGMVVEMGCEGNIGIMELAQYMQVTSETQKRELTELIKAGKNSEAWRLIQNVTGTELVGKQFNSTTT